MASARAKDGKTQALRGYGALNPHPGNVADELFAEGDFFDARDVVQVKYEMLRRARADGWPVNRSARTFGYSRVSFYEARKAVERSGLAGLLPQRPGPRGAHKLSDEVMALVEQARAKEMSLSSKELAKRVNERFGISVHPRSIERALLRRQKKRR
jgi:transposase